MLMRVGYVAVIAIGAGAIWLLLSGLPWPGRILATVLLALLPPLALAQVRWLAAMPGEVPRGSAYLSSGIALWLLAAAAVIAGFASGFTPTRFGFVALPAGELLGWTAATFAALVAVVIATRWLPSRETTLLEALLPRTRAEKLGFAGLSATAGIAEETAFRGFLIPALTPVLGFAWAAAVLSSVAFGLLHGYQGRVGIVRSAVLGFLLAASFVLSGSIVPAAIAHALLNVFAGIVAADWLLRR